MSRNLKNVVNYILEKLNNTLKQKKELISRRNNIEIEINEIENAIIKMNETIDIALDVFTPNNKEYVNKRKLVSEMSIKKDLLNETIECLNSEIEKVTIEEKELKKYVKDLEAQLNHSNGKHDLSDKYYGIKILEQNEVERQRVARDLHDSTVQVLTNLVHKSELCMRIMDMDPIRAKLELEIINNTLRFTIDDMRNIIHNLRPMSFDDLGLEITLERVISQLKYNTDIEIHLNIVGEKIDLPSVTALTLVRVIQEACNNSIKYSKAKNIYIEFVYLKDKIKLIIEDDGIGFNTGKIKNSDNISGLGISIMKERAMLLSGEFELLSEIDKGTLITLTVPV